MNMEEHYRGRTKYNLIGNRYGKLVVIEKDMEKSGNNTYWKCQCDCGNNTSVQTHNLTSGKTKKLRMFRPWKIG